MGDNGGVRALGRSKTVRIGAVLLVLSLVAVLAIVIGFLPDTFSYTWFGSIRDAAGDDKEAAFHQIFMILGSTAILAALCAIGLLLVVRARAKKTGQN